MIQTTEDLVFGADLLFNYTILGNITPKTIFPNNVCPLHCIIIYTPIYPIHTPRLIKTRTNNQSTNVSLD